MGIRDDVMTIHDKVAEVLEQYPGTRNCDRDLIITVLVSLGLVSKSESGVFIPFRNFDELPSFESITRCRRKIQAPPPDGEGRFLPCDEVREGRREQEQSMREINKWLEPSSDASDKRPRDRKLF